MQRVYGRKARTRAVRGTQQHKSKHDTLALPSDKEDEHASSPSPRKRRRIAAESPSYAISDPERCSGLPAFTAMSPPAKRSPLRSSSTSPRERQATPDDSIPSPSKTLHQRPVRTYAGPSRSFLVALPVPGTDFPYHAEGQGQEEASQESYADLRDRWGVDKSEDDPLPVEDTASPSRRLKRNSSTTMSQASLTHSTSVVLNDLKSITELRNKGESRRFMDEVGYLFEGLEVPSAITLRRTSALEIVNKLCDPDFNRRAKTFDFYVHTWDKFSLSRGGVSDKIFDAIVAFFATLAARDARTLEELGRRSDFVDTLVDILASVRDKMDIIYLAATHASMADFKACGISRSEVAVVMKLSEMVSDEMQTHCPHKPSVRFLVSHTLAALPAALGGQHLPPILASLEAELNLLESSLVEHGSGSSILQNPGIIHIGTVSLEHVESCLRLVDSFLLGQWSTADINVDPTTVFQATCSDGLASKFLGLCTLSQVQLWWCKLEEERTLAWKCLCGTMRVLTLLSHGDIPWCEAMLQEEYALPFVALVTVRSQSSWSNTDGNTPPLDTSQAFDLLCLSLGLMMNWATMSDKVSSLCREQLINPECRACMQACQCSERQSILHCLAMLYTHHATSEDDLPESAFLRGYMAVLLGLLVKDSTANLDIVIAVLPGKSSSEKIRSLIHQCRSFIDLYSQTASSLTIDSTPPVSQVRDRRKGSWDKSGEEVARGVIASLESLCISYPV